MALELAAVACPRCRAHLRPGAPWCTQCFLPLVEPADGVEPGDVERAGVEPGDVERADVRPADVGPGAYEPVPVPTARPGGPDDGEDPDLPCWPCSACRTRNPLAASVCAGCGAGFLGALHEARPPMPTLPVVGDLTRLSGAQRLGVAAALVFAVMLLTALLGLLPV